MNRIIVVLLFCVFSLFAAEGEFSMDKLNEEVRDPMSYNADKDAKAREEISPVIVVFRIAGSLALLSAMIIGIVWGVKKTGITGSVPTNSEGALELLEELTTASGNSVVMVRFNDKVLLLGQTGSSITPLETVEGDSALQLIAQSAGGRSVGSFRANLNKYMGTLQKGNPRA